MLASITSATFNEWKVFYSLEPDGDERNDWGLAHVVQALARNGKALREFALPFGDAPPLIVEAQSLEHQTRLIDAWCIGANAIAAAKSGKR